MNIDCETCILAFLIGFALYFLVNRVFIEGLEEPYNPETGEGINPDCSEIPYLGECGKGVEEGIQCRNMKVIGPAGKGNGVPACNIKTKYRCDKSPGFVWCGSDWPGQSPRQSPGQSPRQSPNPSQTPLTADEKKQLIDFFNNAIYKIGDSRFEGEEFSIITKIVFSFDDKDQLPVLLSLLDRNTKSLVNLPEGFPPILDVELNMGKERSSEKYLFWESQDINYTFKVANCFKDDIIGISASVGQSYGVLNKGSLLLLPNLKCLYLSGLEQAEQGPDYLNVSGSLSDLSHLSHLTELYLRYTDFSGSLRDLSHLSNLTYLTLTDDHELITLGGNLSDLKNLKKLKELRLSGKGFRGDLKNLKDFTNFTNLTVLGLVSKNVSGSLSDLSDLKNLEFLDLAGSGVSGNLSDLKNLINLTGLVLESKNVSGDLSDLSDLKNLEFLDLAGSGVSGNLSNLKKLKDLINLDLTGTNISGKLSDLSGLTNLKNIYLCPNSSITGDVPDVPAIQGIYERGDTDLDQCDNVTKIKVIDCSSERYNCMCGVSPVTCSN